MTFKATSHLMRMLRQHGVASLLVAVVVLGLGGFVVHAASGSQPFSVKVSPDKKDVSRGDSAVFNVDVSRSDSFSGDVDLDVTGMPAGVTATWMPTSTVSLPATGSVLLVKVASTTVPGSYPLVVRGTNGANIQTDTLNLNVKSGTSSADFDLAIAPKTQSALQGQTISYTVVAARTGGFSGDIALTPKDMPAGTTSAPVTIPGAASSATFDVAIDPGGFQTDKRYDFKVGGAATIGGKSKTHDVGGSFTIRDGYLLKAAPASEDVQRGDSAAVEITVVRSGNFEGPVALSVEGLPNGTSAEFSPSSTVAVPSSSALLIVKTTNDTPLGAFPLVVKGANGSQLQSTPVKLNVKAGTNTDGDFDLTLTPRNQAAAAPTATTPTSIAYTVAVPRTSSFAGPVTLTTKNLPSGVTAAFSPNPVVGGSSVTTLTVTLPAGADYKLGKKLGFKVSGTGTSNSGKSKSHDTDASFTVEAAAPPFQIDVDSPTLPDLGSSARLDLKLTNPNSFDLLITNLTVAVSGASNPACDLSSNFIVAPYSGPYPLVLHPGGATKLSELGVSLAELPSISIPDLPTVNQDGCQGATFNLAFSGMASK